MTHDKAEGHRAEGDKAGQLTLALNLHAGSDRGDDELLAETDGERRKVFAHMFIRPDGDRVAIVWVRDDPMKVTLKTGGSGAVSEYRLDGSRTQRRGEAGTIAGGDLSPGVPRLFRIGR